MKVRKFMANQVEAGSKTWEVWADPQNDEEFKKVEGVIQVRLSGDANTCYFVSIDPRYDAVQVIRELRYIATGSYLDE